MPPPAVQPDTSIRALDPLDGAVIRYNIGERNWASPWVPNLAQPGQRVLLSGRQVIDVVILGDGYTKRKQFEDELVEWAADFYALEVYRQFAGAFRIQALFTRSAAACDLENRNTYYQVRADDDGVDRNDEWWNGTGPKNTAFRTKVQDSLDRFTLNHVRYPTTMTVEDDPVIHDVLAGLKSNLVLVMLVRTATNSNTEGMTRVIDTLHLNVGFGSHSIHEFGHAFAYLEDEYIDERNRPGEANSIATRKNPAVRSVFTLSNLTFDPHVAAALWGHLSPWGTVRRTASATMPSPVVGWLWRGGEDDLGVWHSEYHCLMNGRNHENYAYSDDEGDSTKNTDLRFREPVMFCLWCQELAALRILEKTGQLARADDPEDINARGRMWYARWVEEFRPLYWEFFDLPYQIQEREEIYAHPESYPDSDTFKELKDSAGSYRPLAGSNLYQPFNAQPLPTSTPPAWSEAEEILVTNG
jgi:hypothetical protein